MKKIFIAALIGFSSFADPVPHAVLNSTLSSIHHFENIDAGLVDQYRNDPSKAAKVEKYRLLIVPEKPTPTLQETVEPFGTNISDGGYILTPTNVTQVWRLRPWTPQEISAINASTADAVSFTLDDLVRTNNWEQRHLRMVYLQSEILFYMTRALIGANLQTNLTVPQRQRFNAISNELVELWNLRQYGRTNYYFVLTNSLVTLIPTNWPNTMIDE